MISNAMILQMHRLQKHILYLLLRHPYLRYADLKPADVEGNLFMYHLKTLMKANLVGKRADGRYELTAEGNRFVDGLSVNTLTPRAQPKIVTLLVCRNEAGEYLLMRRKRHPLYGMTGFPFGKLHIGETIAEAAARELREKTGLECALTHRGDGYINMARGGEPVSHIMFHLFYGENPTGELKRETTPGSLFWARPENVPAAELMPSVPDLLQLLEESGERFFVEKNYDLGA